MSTDPKAIRRYQAGVERALGLFDASNEWADYIAFLSRLGKALQASPPGAAVPFKPTLAKYLALCLKPSLPSGVHQKALEVYNFVFTLLGKDGLSRDLAIWLPGVSHTLTFASLTTRPLFLNLYDEHLLRLPSHVLRPALRAIVLSLLPGLEEETSEDFDHTLNTVNRLRQIFAQDDAEEFFWQSLFLASITSVSKRPGALVYLTRQLPRLGPKPVQSSTLQTTDGKPSGVFREEIRAVTTPEPGLLVRCFATGLQDEQPLVQRGFLDLLVSHLPLNAGVLQDLVSPGDLDVLVSSAMSVVLRRDMSLNRRLWTWFVGREDKREGSMDITHETTPESALPAKQSAPPSNRHEYFAAYGLESVTRSLQSMLRKQSISPVDRARPFRILLSLMDRWIIGRLSVEALFIPIIRDLQQYQTTAPSQASFDEVFRSANVFFDAIEPQVTGGQLFRLLKVRDLDLIEFIIANFNLHEEEMMTTHVPMLCLAISDWILAQWATGSQDLVQIGVNGAHEQRLFHLLDAFLSLSPVRPSDGPVESLENVPTEGWMERLSAVYEKSSQTKKTLLDTVRPNIAVQLLLRNVTVIILDCMRLEDRQNALGPLVNVLAKIISRTSSLEVLRQLDLGDHLHAALTSMHANTTAFKYEVARTVTRVVDTVHAFDSSKVTLTDQHLFGLIPELVYQFWDVLLPRTPQFHVEAVEQIWNLRPISGHLLLVDSKIMDLMCAESQGHLPDQISRFQTLWNHTRFPEVNAELFSANHRIEDDEVPWAMLRHPVLSIVDGLELSQTDDPRRTWLSNLSTILPVCRIIFSEHAGVSDTQLSLIGLHRLHKAVIIARQNSTHRKEMFDPNGFCAMLLDMCIENIASEPINNEAFKMTLWILRIIIEETALTRTDTLVNLLLLQLNKVVMDSHVQENVLDTLQVIFAKLKSEPPPTELMTILISGISAATVDATLEKWITLLCNIIPLYSTQQLFANMLKLTACFCQRIKSYFETLQRLCEKPTTAVEFDGVNAALLSKNPERSINNLLAGLEYILARAHTHLADHIPGTEQPIASTAELSQSRSVANNRLTVVLCMQDTIKLCGDIWAWRIQKRPANAIIDNKSFAYLSSRLRTRTRRILEHLADAEPQECLETLMGMWVTAASGEYDQDVTLNLMQSLDGARPKFMMPATFNAIYNRTNPSALDQSQKSSLSVDVTAFELMSFLIAYTRALEDDLLEEIWTDCTAFLREVLANPMPHRQILLKLLQFVAVVCQKMENTNFGEVSKMRRELADLCARLFTAIFTIRPAGLDSTAQRISDATAVPATPGSRKSEVPGGNAIRILCDSLPTIGNALGDLDRLNNTLSGIALHITGPALRSKQFPQTVDNDILRLVLLMAKSQLNNKTWKKDLLEVFNHEKFFQSPASIAEEGWIPLLKQVCLSDKGLVTDLVSRLTPPTTAGIVFGVGATAARTEADRRTQLTLRRIALLLIACDRDTFVSDLVQIIRKLEELLTATPSSSPSSNTRADIYIVLRAMALAFSQFHLVSVWPIVDAELRDLFTSIQKAEESTFTGYSQLQGAKLLDLLLLLKPEEFQLHEWLFVTDTVDAVYPPENFKSAAIADLIALTKGEKEIELPSVSDDEARRPWLCTDMSRRMDNPEALLRPFFRQLSIHAFEDTYSLQAVDLEACRSDLLADLFVD
ncbi:Dopey, N-terminal-domain-containing protein [Exophiala viscosa]|uniref:Dopey, N-terminal-domain-containing protein n=1 Tax=Exophiala viscosa TaxID=2486360 RepID=A0AAN6DLY1_9EURO|nr:Dopey, N-terminal-domain-containing protein [Exophiala viscosa]KAI1628431.1 Dopey, N-terminal-domain-containing protein [Exophiala viscosa]